MDGREDEGDVDQGLHPPAESDPTVSAVVDTASDRRWSEVSTSETGPLAALARYRASSALIVLGVVLLSGLVGAVVGDDTGATTTVELTTPGEANPLAAGGTGDATASRYTGQRAAFATSDAVLGPVARESGRTVVELREIVTVATSPGSNTLTFTVVADDPATSARLTDALVAAYRERSQAQVRATTDAALEAISTSEADLRAQLAEPGPGGAEGPGQAAAAQAAAITISALDQQANALTTERAVFGDGVQFVEEATPGDGLGVPVRELALGLLVGLGLATVVAWLRADRDRRVVDGASAAAALAVPLLGEVVAEDGYDDGGSGLAELPAAPYRPVVPALSLRTLPGVLLVTSIAAGEGRTQTALNLAVAMAREGRRVALVDADVERRDLSRALGAGLGMKGVSDVLLEGRRSWADLVATVAVVPGTRLALLPAGTPGLEAVEVQLPRVADLVAQLRASYDLVVVDAAPLGGGGLPAVLARLSDSVLVVARRGGPWSGLERLRRLLALYGTPVTGVVLTFAGTGHRRRRHRARPVRPVRRPGPESVRPVLVQPAAQRPTAGIAARRGMLTPPGP